MTYDELLAENRRLRDEVETLRAENRRLRSMIPNNQFEDTVAETPAPKLQDTGPKTRQETIDSRVELFRSLFRGRDDVYARRWTNKSGDSGYSPVCEIAFRKELGCGRPKVQCSDCKVKKWIPLNDDILYQHLAGEKKGCNGSVLKAMRSNPTLYFEDLANDEARNRLIVDDVTLALKNGRTPIILTKRKEHVTILADMLDRFCPNVIRLIGTAPTREKKEAMERLMAIPAEEPLVVVAIGKYVGEGFDFPRLDTLFIALPVAYANIVHQYTGRLHREYAGKREVQVYDYIDIHVPVLARMYGKRMKSYAPIGYIQQTSDILEENPQDIIFGRDNFFQPLISDIRVAKKTVILSVRSLRMAKKSFAQTVNDIAKRGVGCRIYVQDSSDQDAKFLNKGIDVVLRKDMHILAAVIDRRILWYGNINFTGGNYPDDNTMRIIEPAIASEVMGYLMEGE